MRLYEFQAKRLFAEAGIPVPASRLIVSPDQVSGLSFPAVLKAQVPVGGRGKAGGIRLVTDLGQAETAAKELLGSDIRGYAAGALLAEEVAQVQREAYLAVALDKGASRVTVVGSAEGGVDIEEVAQTAPDKIVSRALDPFLGLLPFTVRSVAKELGIQDTAEFGAVLRAMYDLLRAHDATLVEINPLAVTARGLLALDAKVILDDKAVFRHGSLHATLAGEHQELARAKRTLAEELAAEHGVTYVLLDGDVGVIADGAGTGMLALDLIQDTGGRPANFCELGGLADPLVMRRSMEVVLANPQVKAMLITLIGGLTRMDEMAQGIVQYGQHNGLSVPAVIRMAGTREEAGKAILGEAGLGTFDDLTAAVEAVVSLAQAGA